MAFHTFDKVLRDKTWLLKVRKKFEGEGFLAAKIRRTFLDAKGCSIECEKLVADDLLLSFRNNIPIPGQTKLMKNYDELRRDTIYRHQEEWAEVLAQEWSQFSDESNEAVDEPIQFKVDTAHSRRRAIANISKHILQQTFPNTQELSTSELSSWNPYFKEVNAAYHIGTEGTSGFFATFRTPKPLSRPINWSDFESRLDGSRFDQCIVGFWITDCSRPDFVSRISWRPITELSSTYWRFNSARGFMQICRAHVALAKNLLVSR